MNYKMVIQYDGTRYDGWQKQGNTDRTIQGRLEQVLSRMEGEEIEIHGAGRTAESHELLAAEMRRAGPAVTRAGENLHVIYEVGTCHNGFLFKGQR